MKKDFLRSVGVLSLIAVVAGLLLGLMYQITYLSDEEKEARMLAKLSAVYVISDAEKLYQKGGEDNRFESEDPSLNKMVSYFYEAKNESGETVYVIVCEGKGGNGGNIEMYTVISSDCIVKLASGTNSETPGFKDKVFTSSFYEKFYGRDLAELEQFELKGSGENGVDAVSGATYTSTGTVNAINNAVRFYLEFKSKEGQA